MKTAQDLKISFSRYTEKATLHIKNCAESIPLTTIFCPLIMYREIPLPPLPI